MSRQRRIADHALAAGIQSPAGERHRMPDLALVRTPNVAWKII
jgi:hypothetical protein